MEFPKTLQEFQAAFPDEDSCWTTLRNVQWPRGFICPYGTAPIGLVAAPAAISRWVSADLPRRR